VYGDLNDTPLIQAFLFKYRTFVSSVQLFEILMDMNNPPKELPIKYSNFDARKKVIMFLNIWLSNFFFQDFDQKDMYSRVVDFVNDVVKAGQSPDANLIKLALISANRDRIQKRLERRKRLFPVLRQGSTETITRTGATPSMTQSINMWKPDIGSKFLEFSLQTVAEYLTYAEHSLFRQVSLSELASLGWTDTKNSKKLSPNIILSKNKFNEISQWVSTEIVTGSNPKQRALMIERFVALADKCIEMRNYNTSMEILAGINRAFVNRLKKSWNLVSSATEETLQRMNELMDPKHNFRNYREALRKAPKPCLPYLGIYLRDVVFTEEGNKDKVGEFVNFEKIQILGKIYKELLSFQKHKYPQCEDETISSFFKQLCSMPDEVLHQQSRDLEPSLATISNNVV